MKQCDFEPDPNDEYDWEQDRPGEPERQFPTKGFRQFGVRYLAVMVLTAILLVLPFFWNVRLTQNRVFPILYGWVLGVAWLIPTTSFVNAWSAKARYGIKLRSKLVRIYKTAFAVSIVVCVGGFLLTCYGIFSLDKELYTERSIIAAFYRGMMIQMSGLVSAVLVKSELNEVDRYACPICDRLGVLVRTGTDSSVEEVEHTHYEKEHYEEDEVYLRGNSYGSESYEGKIKRYVPGKTVSDGMYEHITKIHYYRCPRCGYSDSRTEHEERKK